MLLKLLSSVNWANIITSVNAQWLVDLRVDHSNVSEQEPVTIMMADVQDKVSYKKTCWQKKMTAFYEGLAAQINQL